MHKMVKNITAYNEVGFYNESKISAYSSQSLMRSMYVKGELWVLPRLSKECQSLNIVALKWDVVGLF